VGDDRVLEGVAESVVVGIHTRGTVATRILAGHGRYEVSPCLGCHYLEATSAGVTGDGAPCVRGGQPVGDHGALQGARLRSAGGSSTLRTHPADAAAAVHRMYRAYAPRDPRFRCRSVADRLRAGCGHAGGEEGQPAGSRWSSRRGQADTQGPARTCGHPRSSPDVRTPKVQPGRADTPAPSRDRSVVPRRDGGEAQDW
jgi:hypothetical protein